MNQNGQMVLAKKRAGDKRLRAQIDSLIKETASEVKSREAALFRNEDLIREVKSIKKAQVENFEGRIFSASKKLRSNGHNVFFAKRPVDVAEYLRDVIKRERLAIVPSPQTIEAEVMQAFFMSNKVEIASEKYAGGESGFPSLHPYIPYPGTEEKAEKEFVSKHVLISAVLMDDSGNAYLEADEESAMSNFADVHILLTADRIYKEQEAEKVAKLLVASSGGAIKLKKLKAKGRAIILDNGRISVSRSNIRAILKCINCYSCSLYCPVYLTVGGLFGAPMMSGIGSASVAYQSGIKAALGRGLNYCTLCKRCDVECPTDVPISDLIVEMRRRAKVAGV